ncbi:4-hydroxythreonine-4-phosphate dehydrogenase [Xenococcus sp. PCC 7305]|uniref:4-hydroxythreonine-4-phosphate dehydrogenase PdxA n=1 Tax=Xenococcus sp. PCC 7305 TaxID=102125 RepID=UPI0002ACAB43|nr:4-hydroxythreonine-4-phosphate dehydrogenase PdxA [Xenococcus sp. PCC 7305]ELS00606.1 4-hydroxythreonine-4-phosphate dehydrogenase [Xenococcus sp. PCC 7305]
MPPIPHLALTIGDPAGIGTEVILKALADLTLDCEITVIGSRSVLQATYEHLLRNGNLSPEDLADPQTLKIIDRPFNKSFQWGQGNASTGAASFDYLETAISLTNEGQFQGIVTAPIAKNLWQQAGHDYPGQTEVLAEGAGVTRFGMLFAGRSPYTDWQLITLLATTHIPLAQVPQTLTPELLSLKLDLLVESLQTDFGISNPTIAIAGLNPHSGEAGQLGTEELYWMSAWLEKEQQEHYKAKLIGLIPPDTMWVKPGQAWYGSVEGRGQRAEDRSHEEVKSQELDFSGVADAYLALYHDQGLIPVKLMAFDRAVNTTIGLPFIRTSPDHGTAFDIAGKGIADAKSMQAAIALAVEIIHCRIGECKSFSNGAVY